LVVGAFEVFAFRSLFSRHHAAEDAEISENNTSQSILHKGSSASSFLASALPSLSHRLSAFRRLPCTFGFSFLGRGKNEKWAADLGDRLGAKVNDFATLSEPQLA
jgi:hypothetical protein